MTSVIIRATYAEGSSMFFKTNTISIPVGTSCYNTTCANGGGAPPPPPPTPPPPPPPTTDPNAPPVYPLCINAPLLANPCLLGKRCFYDKECKPQMEDMSKLLSPNCENAVPLRNPWPAGKCCFYDSQVIIWYNMLRQGQAGVAVASWSFLLRSLLLYAVLCMFDAGLQLNLHQKRSRR